MHVRESTIEQELIEKLAELKYTLRNRSAVTRDDGTPLNYALVNINDWWKNVPGNGCMCSAGSRRRINAILEATPRNSAVRLLGFALA